MFTRILFPTDGSDHAYKALDLAIDMAKKYDAELVILHVPHGSEDIEALRRFAEIEGLAPHINKEIDRLRTIDYRISVVTDSAFQDTRISPRVLIVVGHLFIEHKFQVHGLFYRQSPRDGTLQNTICVYGCPVKQLRKIRPV